MNDTIFEGSKNICAQIIIGTSSLSSTSYWWKHPLNLPWNRNNKQTIRLLSCVGCFLWAMNIRKQVWHSMKDNEKHATSPISSKKW